MKLLEFNETKKILKDLGLETLETSKVENKEEVLSFAQKDFPLFLKVFSPSVFHRTEDKLVKKVNSEKELEEKIESLKEKASEYENAFLIAQKQGKGKELFLGMKKDSVFGWVVMFGIGGIFLEVIDDISYGICPLDKKECICMIKDLKAFPYLQGTRGQGSVDIEKLASFIKTFSQIPKKHSEVKEVDFNPVFVSGGDIKVADFKIFI